MMSIDIPKSNELDLSEEDLVNISENLTKLAELYRNLANQLDYAVITENPFLMKAAYISTLQLSVQMLLTMLENVEDDELPDILN